MKILVMLIGLVVSLFGLIPLLSEQELLPSALAFIPISGWLYQLILIVLGLLTVYYGFKTD